MDNKVITRRGINALKEGTFSEDLDKAVLYGEVSENPDFIVEETNSASGLRYTPEQALLEADIRVSAEIIVTLEPRRQTIGESETTVVLEIATAGTQSVGTPVYSVMYATYDGEPTTALLDENNLTLTLSFPANQDYTPKEIEAKVKLVIDNKEFESNQATATQERVRVNPSLSITYNAPGAVSAASGETTSFTISAEYITGITGFEVSDPASVVSSSSTGVTIAYPANPNEQSGRTYTVTIHGNDVYGSAHTDSCEFAQAADTYAFRFSSSSVTVAATSTTETVNIISENIGTIGVSSYTENVTSAIISQNNELVVGYEANERTEEKQMLVTITGLTYGGRTVSATLLIEQLAAEEVVFAIAYDGDKLGSGSGATDNFSIFVSEAEITGFTVDGGASIINSGTSFVEISYPANPAENDKKYTVKMEGTNTFGEYVSASTEVTQSADSYEFNLSPVSNPIAASASTAAFNLTGTSVSGIGYYPAQSQNINGIGGLSSNSVTATGITPNSGSTDKDIVLVLSGKTNAGRTVYATGTTLQVHSRSGFGFEGGFDVNPGATSTTVEYTYKYLTGSTLTLYASDGAYFDSAHTSTSTTVNVTPNSAERTESVNVFFDANGGSVKTYTISNGAVKGEAGESFTDSVVITHKAERKITVTPKNGSTSDSSGTVTFTVTWENFERSDLINLSPTNVTIPSSTIVLTSESGTTAITATKTANTGTTTRDLTLEASYGSGSEKISDTGLIVQNVPAGSLRVRVIPAERDIPSDSGSCVFYIDWSYLKPGAKITFNSNNITNYSPTSITITNANYTGYTGYTVTANYTANPGTSERFLELTGTSVDLRSSSRTSYDFYMQTGTIIYNPDIWWTKTSEGEKSTEVTGITDVPAFVPNTYDGGNVTYTIYINYNSDVSTVSMDTSHLSNGASATRNGKTVTITAPANSGSSRSLGYINVTGTAPDGTTDTARLNVTQVGGVSTSLLIEGDSSHIDTNDIPYSGGQRSYGYTYSNVGLIGTGSTSGAATGSSLNSSNLTVRFSENTSTTSRTWKAAITGKTVFGNVVTATTAGEQGAEPVKAIDVVVEGQKTSNAGGACNRLRIYWSGLTVGSYIDLSSTAGITLPVSQVQVTAVTGDYKYDDYPYVSENTGGTRTVGVTARWRNDTSVSDSETWSQSGGYVPPVVRKKVWVKSMENMIYFTNNTSSAITVDTCSVAISEGGLGLYLNGYATIPAGAVNSGVTAVRRDTTGYSAYNITMELPQGTSIQTTINWKANGSTQSVIDSGESIGTGAIDVTQDTEISDVRFTFNTL